MAKTDSNTLEAERAEDFDIVHEPALRSGAPEVALASAAVSVEGRPRATAVLQRDRSVKVVPVIR